jgi:hypothetical protein
VIRRTSPLKRSRFGVARVKGSDGRSYGSAWEREACSLLRLRERVGEIRDLRFQVWFHLEIGGVRIESYVADAVYTDAATDAVVIVDAKNGLITDTYRRKRKWMAATGRPITEMHKTRRA